MFGRRTSGATHRTSLVSGLFIPYARMTWSHADATDEPYPADGTSHRTGQSMRTEPHAAGKSIPATAHSCNRTDKCHRYCFGRTLRRNGTDGRTISAHAQHRKDKSQSRAARAAIRKDMGERKERRSTDRKKTTRSPDRHAVRPSIRSDGRPAVQPFGRSLDRSLAHPFIQSAVKRADGQTGEIPYETGKGRHDSARERCEHA